MSPVGGFAVDRIPFVRTSPVSPLAIAAARGPQHRAALFLLVHASAFADRPLSRVSSYITPSGGIRFPDLLSQSHWSTGERLVIEAASSVFGCEPDGQGTVKLNLLDIRSGLDGETRQLIYQAIELAL